MRGGGGEPGRWGKRVNNVQVEGCGRIKETDFFRLRFNQKETKASGKIYEVLKGMEEGCLRS